MRMQRQPHHDTAHAIHVIHTLAVAVDSPAPPGCRWRATSTSGSGLTRDRLLHPSVPGRRVAFAAPAPHGVRALLGMPGCSQQRASRASRADVAQGRPIAGRCHGARGPIFHKVTD